jgi:uncharacterized protein (TIGR03435 family)
MTIFDRLKQTCPVALFLLILPIAAAAQTQSAIAVASAELSPAPSFETATIKPDTSGSGGSSSGYGRDDRFTATNSTIQSLLQWAFQISGRRIVGGPKWLDSARFDINAKMDQSEFKHVDSVSWNEKVLLIGGLVQRLLVDRFQMKTHWEEREQPVYALVIAKGGSKLKPVADAQHGSMKSRNYGKIQATDVTPAEVAELLTEGTGNELGRIVVDRTGIQGAFDLDLRWTPESGTSPADPSSPATSGPSLFSAIQEQLGLRLEPAKAPVRVLVIDHLELPSEN